MRRSDARLSRLRFAHVSLASLELDLAVLQREDRVIAAQADIEAGMELGASLADDDGAGGDELPAVDFDSSVLCIAVATVLGGALTLLMCHVSPSKLT